ncbi:hypothetical protein BFJ66_g10945 [Fusarium oxysporum f. sp. cepae]|uniref:Cytochrome P450 n=1 Tax=Fusarium oxysporum f. sp. cepae TaxID=396571 RepID=A0A3L6N456_FUSOX|nr:hypothetical protein BFJ65_g14037 [Fusarium oxysporum f. sp. cepae]RKK41581.1 hypothetical protein BFJ66_g10945 [Fusarium oxysporum f. sp. cepae]RKK48884.1 hypothetical protein BFJ67_g7135 [Fusarium oxysporum f. sp. cepae]
MALLGSLSQFRAFASPQQTVALVLLVLITACAVARSFNKKYKLPNLVPGLPLIGNAHQIPLHDSCLHFQTLAKKYGEMFTVRIGGTYWVFLNSRRVATELLDKRAAIYSSRMNLPMAHEVVSQQNRTLLMPYGDLWRRQRKVMHQILNSNQQNIFHPFQDIESKALLANYLERPEHWYRAHGAFSGSVIMSVVFGRRAGLDDQNMQDSLSVSEEFVNYIAPGRALVDHFPFLIKIPWFKSLQPWRWYGDDLYRRTRRIYKKELDSLRERIKDGSQKPCFMSQFLDLGKDQEFEEDQLLFMGGALMEAGTDTTRLSLDQCVAAAVVWPDWVERARQQLDRICGANAERLPTSQDAPDLPLIKAAVKESVRWKPVIGETGIPHASIKDDEFEGYTIPAGTIVTYNHWAISNSEDEYEQPERFWPERFVNEDLDKPLKGHLGFGAGKHHLNISDQGTDLGKPLLGRRVCVGYNVANTNLFIALARLLYCFDFSAVDESPIDTTRPLNTVDSVPVFKVKIKVRTEAHRKLIERECTSFRL